MTTALIASAPTVYVRQRLQFRRWFRVRVPLQSFPF